MERDILFPPFHDLELFSRKRITSLSCHGAKPPGSPDMTSGLKDRRDDPEEWGLALLSGPPWLVQRVVF